MSEALRMDEADVRLNLAPEHLRTLEREGSNPPARRDFQDHAYSKSNLAFLRAVGVGQLPKRPMSCVELAKAMV